MDNFPWLLILSISGGCGLLVFLIITFVNWRERKRLNKMANEAQQRFPLPSGEWKWRFKRLPLLFLAFLFLPGCDSLTPAERGFLDTTGKRVIGRALDKAFGPEKPVKAVNAK